MFDSTRIKESTGGYGRILFISFLAAISLAVVFSTAAAQTPTPTPVDTDAVTWNGYKVTAVTEVGWRFRSLSGNENKYRSDLNYKAGFRTFDSNLLLQSQTGKGKYFDSLLISNSGWGSDPSGSTRVNMEKTGFYKFNANVRRVTYFNNLTNFVNPTNQIFSQHSQNTAHTFGDFDITFLPQSERLRLTLGTSFNRTRGPGTTTARANGDEFPVSSDTKTNSVDYRVGADGKLFGFDWGLTQGFRVFKDRSSYFLNAPNAGNNTTNQSRLDTFSRSFPTDGNAYYTQFNLHRTIAKTLDFTARMIYTSTRSRSSMLELETGRDNTNPVGNIIDLDRYVVSSNAKRPQTRADLGVTYLVTEKFRISNTFSFDQFAVNGSEVFDQYFNFHSATRTTTRLTHSTGYRVQAYRRFLNTIEGDYQINNSIGFHVGYRYTKRNIVHNVIDFSRTDTTVVPGPSPASTTSLTDETEGETNSTNTVIAGMKIKPVKNWVIYWDVERGQADNVFTRVENYKFTNFRVRSRLTVNKFTFNVSAISKDNENPSRPSVDVPLPANLIYVTTVKNKFYSGSVDWEPLANLSFSGGYTYQHLTSYTPIVFPVQISPPTTTIYSYGFSQFFIRNHYAYLDVSAKPFKRMSLYASYRINRDKGQGNLISPVIPNTFPTLLNGGINVFQNLIGSYPMQFQSPEVRVVFRITRNIDWNVGYQYYNYKDSQTPFQNYRAHLPYTSLRIYFGGGAADR